MLWNITRVECYVQVKNQTFTSRKPLFSLSYVSPGPPIYRNTENPPYAYMDTGSFPQSGGPTHSYASADFGGASCRSRQGVNRPILTDDLPAKFRRNRGDCAGACNRQRPLHRRPPSSLN